MVRLLLPLITLLSANSILLTSEITELRYFAAWLILGILPGAVWLPLGGMHRPAFRDQSSQHGGLFTAALDGLEQAITAIGLSLALTIIGTMYLVYALDPLTGPQILWTANGWIVLGLVGQIITGRGRQTCQVLDTLKVGASIGTLLLLLVALRLPNLGYAEFHEDEAEALMLGVRLLQGEDYALFLHRKGPAQMLLPVAFWLITDQINEAMARLPFAVSSILSGLTLFVIGRRWFGWQAGLVAGMLWAVNGYSIGFGRMVQYQALIFFLGPLAIYLLDVARRTRQPGHLPIAATLLATALLAHFDALLLLPAAAMAWWRAKPEKLSQAFWSAWWVALLIFITVLASFYVPFVNDPEFTNTTDYLAESRIKPGLLYNNLNLLQTLDTAYSSQFFLPLVMIGLLGAVIMSRKKRRFATTVLTSLLVLASTTYLWPTLWQFNEINLSVLPWLGLGGWVLFNAATPEIRLAWLMFGAGFIGYLFVVDDPRTHLYIFYPGAMLLAGYGLGQVCNLVLRRLGDPTAQLRHYKASFVVIPASVWLTLVGGGYVGLIFLSSEAQLDSVRADWDGSIWAVVYDDLPDRRQYFGYPKREGWKAIGALQAQGELPGDFRSRDEDFIIPIWYAYGEARSCYTDPAHLFIRTLSTPTDIPAPYQPRGRIIREGEARIWLYAAYSDRDAQDYELADYEARFDALATPSQFISQAAPSRAIGTQFGPAIQLRGIDLPSTEFAPGETIPLNLYWQALAEPKENYRAFAHLTDGTHLWAQQDDTPACRLPTTVWRTGQTGLGQFRLTISPDTPAGQYPLIIGLYQADTLERLPIMAGPGTAGDDFLWLGDVTVGDQE